jgi:hypothetical protein
VCVELEVNVREDSVSGKKKKKKTSKKGFSKKQKKKKTKPTVRVILKVQANVIKLAHLSSRANPGDFHIDIKLNKVIKAWVSEQIWGYNFHPKKN